MVVTKNENVYKIEIKICANHILQLFNYKVANPSVGFLNGCTRSGIIQSHSR